MTSIAFDTLKLAQALKAKAHLTTEQAEGFAEALADALHDDLATKADLREVKAELKVEIEFGQIRNHQMDVRHDWLSDGDHPRRGDRADAHRASVSAQENRFAGVAADLRLLKWMAGLKNLTITMATLFLALTHRARTARPSLRAKRSNPEPTQSL